MNKQVVLNMRAKVIEDFNAQNLSTAGLACRKALSRCLWVLFYFFIMVPHVSYADKVGGGTDGEVEVELTHWWKSAGERAALAEIEAAVTARGAKFKAVAIENYDKLRARIVERLALGIPPSMTQWLGGRDMQALIELGAIQSVPNEWRGEKIQDILFPEVLDEIMHGNQIAGIPVGIHIQNSAFYNAKIYSEVGLKPPLSWQEFLGQAEKIQAAGYIPIALSDAAWQIRRIFDAIFMEKVGVEHFQSFYDESQKIEQWREDLQQSIALLMKLRTFADEGHVDRLWHEVADLMIEGKAAMQVMGDFVEGEIVQAHLQPGVDFFCELAPGANGVMIYDLDSFVMLSDDDASFKRGQQLLFDVILDPDVQAAFHGKKGGIPVRRGVDINKLDACGQKLYRSWEIEQGSTKHIADTRSRLRLAFVQNVLQSAWKENRSVNQTTDDLINLVDKSVGK